MSTKLKRLDSRQEWHDDILQIISSLSVGTLFTSDNLRATALRLGLGRPQHPSSWGAVLTAAQTGKLIKKTGRYLPSKIPANHSAVIAQWKRL